MAAIAATLWLSACSFGPTPYQSRQGDQPYGYTEQQIDPATWRVQFSGNLATSRETVEDYLLYRAAEIMRMGGYDRFLLLEKEIEADVTYNGVGFQPSFGVGFGSSYNYGVFGSVPATYAPQTRYKGTALVRVYSAGQSGGPIFSAGELIKQIRPRIVWPQPG